MSCSVSVRPFAACKTEAQRSLMWSFPMVRCTVAAQRAQPLHATDSRRLLTCFAQAYPQGSAGSMLSLHRSAKLCAIIEREQMRGIQEMR